jgi:hypothetical protein
MLAPQMAIASPLDTVIMGINTNPYFIGLMMLLLNFGGRFLSLEMSKGQEAFFYNTWVRRTLIFIVIFVGTRNVMVAFLMSFVIILCIGYLFNENSSLCIFKIGVPGSTCADKKEGFETAFDKAAGTIAATAAAQLPPTPLTQSVTPPQMSANLTKEENYILNILQQKMQGIQAGQQGQRKEGNQPFKDVSSENKPKTEKDVKNTLGMYFTTMNKLQGA